MITLYADNRKAFNLAHNPKLGFQTVKKRKKKNLFYHLSMVVRGCEDDASMDGFTWLGTEGYADRRALIDGSVSEKQNLIVRRKEKNRIKINKPTEARRKMYSRFDGNPSCRSWFVICAMARPSAGPSSDTHLQVH